VSDNIQEHIDFLQTVDEMDELIEGMFFMKRRISYIGIRVFSKNIRL
jgi:hypothetical protein